MSYEDTNHPNRLAWMARGACVGMDADLFFPERGASTAAAKAVCFRCPVREQCLAYGFTQRFGIWGGMSERERRRIRRSRRLARETAA